MGAWGLNGDLDSREGKSFPVIPHLILNAQVTSPHSFLLSCICSPKGEYYYDEDLKSAAVTPTQ